MSTKRRKKSANRRGKGLSSCEPLEDRRLMAVITFEEPIPAPGDVQAQYAVEGANNFGVNFRGITPLSITPENDGNRTLRADSDCQELCFGTRMDADFTSAQEFVSVDSRVSGQMWLCAFDTEGVQGGAPRYVSPSIIGYLNGSTGTGFLRHSEEPVDDRFGIPSSSFQHNLVVAKNINGRWYYDTGSSIRQFTPRVSDLLIAEIDFDRETVVDLEGYEDIVQGIELGHAGGNLQFELASGGSVAVAGSRFYRRFQNVPLQSTFSGYTGDIPPLPKFVPPHVAGDAEFGGDGPDVFASTTVRISSDGRSVEAQTYMSAVESGGGCRAIAHFG